MFINVFREILSIIQTANLDQSTFISMVEIFDGVYVSGTALVLDVGPVEIGESAGANLTVHYGL